MSSRWTGFFVWALVAASAVFWGVRIFAATRPVPSTAVLPQESVAAQGPMTHLFGAVQVDTPEQPRVPPESERFQLLGVIAPRTGAAGALALVSVDGQPAKAWRIGATIDGDTTLLAVARRSADFGPSGGPSAFTLQLPEPAAPETGTLPSAVPGADGTGGHVVQSPSGVQAPPGLRGATAPGGLPARPAFGQRPGIVAPGMIPQMGVPTGRSLPTLSPQPVMPGQAPTGEDTSVKDDQ